MSIFSGLVIFKLTGDYSNLLFALSDKLSYFIFFKFTKLLLISEIFSSYLNLS